MSSYQSDSDWLSNKIRHLTEQIQRNISLFGFILYVRKGGSELDRKAGLSSLSGGKNGSIRQYQADIMLVLSGICGIITLFVYLTSTMSENRKLILMQMELGAMFLLIADRKAYLYRGDTSKLGWWMVRISNFLVFF